MRLVTSVIDKAGQLHVAGSLASTELQKELHESGNVEKFFDETEIQNQKSGSKQTKDIRDNKK